MCINSLETVFEERTTLSLVYLYTGPSRHSSYIINPPQDFLSSTVVTYTTFTFAFDNQVITELYGTSLRTIRYSRANKGGDRRDVEEEKMKLSAVGFLALLGMAEATQNNIQRRGGGARLDKLGLFEAAPLPHRRQAGNDSMTSAPAPATTSPPPSSAAGSDPGAGAVTTQLVTVNQSVAVTTTQSLWNNSTVTLTLPCSSCAGGVTTTTATLPCTTTTSPVTIPTTTAAPALIVTASPSS
ncbi:hypothetical protein PGQ11_002387, partial [Apiospora arundinis]